MKAHFRLGGRERCLMDAEVGETLVDASVWRWLAIHHVCRGQLDLIQETLCPIYQMQKATADLLIGMEMSISQRRMANHVQRGISRDRELQTRERTRERCLQTRFACFRLNSCKWPMRRRRWLETVRYRGTARSLAAAVSMNFEVWLR